MKKCLRIALACVLAACLLVTAAFADGIGSLSGGNGNGGSGSIGSLSGNGGGGNGGGVGSLGGGSHLSNAAAVPQQIDLGDVSVSVHDNKTLTLMVYLCGSDLESNYGCASNDVFEIAQSNFNTDAVNVLVTTGGSFRWAIPGIPTDRNVIWEMDPAGMAASVAENPQESYTLEEIMPHVRKAMTPVYEGDNTSMGASQTLSDFLEFCHTYYPADDFALVLWNHGGGPNQGVCVDRQFSDDMIKMDELVAGLAASPFATEKLEWIGFDACLMGSAEIAMQVSPYANYMLASEETEPGSGWNYAFLNGIENDASGAVTGQRAVDAFVDELVAAGEAYNRTYDITLSCIDLSQMDAVSQAAEVLFAELDGILTAETYVDFARAREAGANFGHADDPQRSSDYDLVDLNSLVSRLDIASEAARSAMTDALNAAIVYSRSTIENALGLSIYYPYFSTKLYDYFVENFRSVSLSSAYTDFVAHSVDLQKGGTVDWSGMSTISHLGVRDVRSLFSLELTEEQLNFLASASLEVFEDNGSGSYALVSAMPEIEVDGTTLSSEYVHRALFMVDAEGNPTSPGLPYIVLDNGDYGVEVELSAHDENGEELYRDRAMMHFVMSNKEGNLEVTDILGYDEVQGSYLQRFAINLADYDTLEVTRSLREPSEYAEGTLNSWNDWTVTEETVYTCKLSEGEGMMLLHDIIDHSKLYVSFAVRDYQNNNFLSGLTALGGGISPDDNTLILTYDDLEMLVLSNAQFAPRANGAATTATLTLDVQNIFGQEVIVRIENVCFEGDATDLTTDLYGFGENYGLVDQETQRLILTVPSDILLAHPQLTNITFDLVLVDPSDEVTELGRVPVSGALNQDYSFMQA